MPRPKCCRKTGQGPDNNLFIPENCTHERSDAVCLSIDEYEAIKLADFEKLYHEQAAESMEVSRQTFGRIIESARSKIADALINGKIIEIEITNNLLCSPENYKCHKCRRLKE